MKRRTLLKRVGIAGLGTAAIGAGTASARDPPEGMRRVEIDGETYFVRKGVDVDADAIDAGDVCTCEYCPPNLCDYCGPCP